MGIKGLTAFMRNHYRSWERKEIRGRIIIDGSSLVHYLYTFDWTHGGQYPEYKSKICSFFQAIKGSGITPIVVMDGAQVDERRLPKKLSSREERLKTIDKCCREERPREKVIPPLTLQVYLMTLQELGVELMAADGEREFTIYRLANFYSCPVLSNDAEFYIYDLKEGFIPFHMLKWDSIPVEADVYYQVKLFFGVDDPALRLVIPAIVGSDLISSFDDNEFTAYMGRSSPYLDFKDKNARIDIIVNFIQTYSSLERFMEDDFPCLTKNSREKLLENCREAKKLYNSHKTLSLEEMKESTTIKLDYSSEIPGWLLNSYRSGNFIPMRILISSRNILNAFVEDTAKSTCTEASKPIRQFMYGLLGLSEVIEFRRKGDSLKVMEVEASTELTSGQKIPQFQKLPAISSPERAHFLYSILGCSNSEAMFERLDKQWCLAIAATKFWIKQCHPDRSVVEALILCFAVLTTNADQLKTLKMRVRRYFQKDQQWIDAMHAFSSWQSCYGDAFELNQILGMPLQPVSPASLYDGRLLIYLVNGGSRIGLGIGLQDVGIRRLYTKLLDKLPSIEGEE